VDYAFGGEFFGFKFAFELKQAVVLLGEVGKARNYNFHIYDK
jgi:hypothetical protein